MKTVASLLAIIGVLLTRWTDIRGDESMCYKFCCEDNSNINLTNCCSEATSHLLPPRFYSFTCVRQLLELCASSVNDKIAESIVLKMSLLPLSQQTFRLTGRSQSFGRRIKNYLVLSNTVGKNAGNLFCG